MTALAVWVDSIGGMESIDLASTLTADLRRLGVEVVRPSLDTPCALVFGDPRSGAERVATARGQSSSVIAISARAPALAAGSALLLLAAGAADVITGEAGTVARDVIARLGRLTEVEQLLASPEVAGTLPGRSPHWRATLRALVEAAAFGVGSVVLLGESGTGKELAAGLVHVLDRRPGKRELVVVDCTTLAPELAGSELFGHERGAYTGALTARDGAIALADGGTLFLDEIGELPSALQAQLLRAVQERTYKRVGGNAWHRSSFRVVCATNRELDAEVRAGRFRADLYHRLATFVVRLPPLRERPEDILPLALHFLAELRPDLAAAGFDGCVEEVLVRREYPGNVRDLRQLVGRMADRHMGPGPVTAGALDPEDRPVLVPRWSATLLDLAVRRALESGASLKEIGRAATDAAVRLVVEQEHGNLQRAARKLGVSDRALQLRRSARRIPGPAVPA